MVDLWVIEEAATSINEIVDPKGTEHVLPIKCDLSEPQSVQELDAKIDPKFGNIDVVFNNAGGVYRADTATIKDIADS